MKKIIFIIAINSIAATECQAEKAPCKVRDCAETSTIDEPYEIRAREVANYIKNLKENGTEKERWSQLSLYSDSKSPDDFKIPIIKSIDLEMRLDPQKGHLTIEKPGIKHVFQINPPSDVESACPKYGLKIIDASKDHAIIRMYCFALKNKHGKYYRSTDYFLYDMKTADMRSIWSSWMEDKDVKLPYPHPIPAVKKTSYGYQMDWTGINENDPKRKQYSIHTKYVRKINPKTGKFFMDCVDRDDPKDEYVGGPCWAPGAETVLDERTTELNNNYSKKIQTKRAVK